MALGEKRLAEETLSGKKLPAHWRGSLEDFTRRAWAELLPPDWHDRLSSEWKH
jgi:hypothetical protein